MNAANAAAMEVDSVRGVWIGHGKSSLSIQRHVV